MMVYYKHHPLLVILGTGTEINKIKYSVIQFIGATIHKSNQSVVQLDGVTTLKIIDKMHIMLLQSNSELTLEALVISNLDINILASLQMMYLFNKQNNKNYHRRH